MPGAAGPSRLPHLLGNTLAKKKRPYEVVEPSEDEEEIDELEDDIDEAPPSDAESSEDEDGEGGGDHWEYSLRPSTGTSKKRKVSFPPRGPLKHANKRDLDDEVISLSSD